MTDRERGVRSAVVKGPLLDLVKEVKFYDKARGLLDKLARSNTPFEASKNEEDLKKSINHSTCKNVEFVIDYINQLLKEKELWISHYADKFPHFNTHTTGRVESHHRSIKRRMEPGQALQESFLTINQALKNQQKERHVALSQELRTTATFFVSNKQFKDIAYNVSHFAIDLVREEIARALEKKANGIEDTKCTKYIRNVYQVPCRHEFSALDPNIPISINLFADRWIINNNASTSTPYKIQTIAEHAMHLESRMSATLYKFEQFLRYSNTGHLHLKLDAFDEWFETQASKDYTKELLPGKHTKKTVQQLEQERQTLKKQMKIEKLQHQLEKLQPEKKQIAPINNVSCTNSDDASTAVIASSSVKPSKPTKAKKAKEPRIPKERILINEVNKLPSGFADEIRPFYQRYIAAYQVVSGDGNCGFRAVAVCTNRKQKFHLEVRKELRSTLNGKDTRKAMYTEEEEIHSRMVVANYIESIFFRSASDFQEMQVRLSYNSYKQCLSRVEFHMSMPTTGFLIADKYQRPVVFLNRSACCTCLPEKYDPNTANLTPMAILLSADPASPASNHYWPVFLSCNAPLPPPPPIAKRYRNSLEIKSHWNTLVAPFCEAYDELFSFLYTCRPNEDQKINYFIDNLPGRKFTYYSYDQVCDPQSRMQVPLELLNTIESGSLPPHKLVLKIGSPIMILRNLDPSAGLCNGTRLIVKSLGARIIETTIATGPKTGDVVYIPRIKFVTEANGRIPFDFTRTQFPVRLAFAMTINKSQGQTLSNIGLYLPSHVFSYGQLYVAMSRVNKLSSIKIMIDPDIPVLENLPGHYTH